MGIWGKFVGGLAGFAMGGPLGALFGAAAGHAVDRMHDEAGEPGEPPPRLGEPPVVQRALPLEPRP